MRSASSFEDPRLISEQLLDRANTLVDQGHGLSVRTRQGRSEIEPEAAAEMAGVLGEVFEVRTDLVQSDPGAAPIDALQALDPEQALDAVQLEASDDLSRSDHASGS